MKTILTILCAATFSFAALPAHSAAVSAKSAMETTYKPCPEGNKGRVCTKKGGCGKGWARSHNKHKGGSCNKSR